ncbi:MAG TPA: hypothetical protein VF658_16170 [Pyrinomonadaceae bacterium]|jgi:uncharacterized protein (TIGR03437 family)
MSCKPCLQQKHHYASQVIAKRLGRKFLIAILFAFCLAYAGQASAQGTDTTPPQLKSFSFSPTAIDTSASAQTVTVLIGIKDDLSDFNMGDVEFEDPLGNTWGWAFYPSHRISGDSRDGVYRLSATFPRNSPQGTWHVSRVLARAGTQENFTVFTTSVLAASGFPTALQVGSSPPPSSSTADLRVSVTDSPDPIGLSSGQNINYSILVSNDGPALATDVVLVDLLPSGVTFVSATATGGICSHDSGVVVCYLGNVTDGKTVSVIGKPTTAGVFTNIVSVQGNEEDPNPSNNTALVNTTVGTSSTPTIITEGITDRAIALNAATFVRDPFTVITERNFGADKRTRVMLFAINLDLLPGENASAVTAQAESPTLGSRPLPVEYVGKVPGFSWLTQVNVILPGELANAGDVWVSLRLRGVTSNKARINIK